jgi:hypothetical protein
MGNSQARRENERAKQISAKIFAAVGVPGGDKSVGMLGGGTLGSPLSGGGGGGASVKSAGKASSRGGKNRTGRWKWSSTERIKVHSRHRDPLDHHGSDPDSDDGISESESDGEDGEGAAAAAAEDEGGAAGAEEAAGAAKPASSALPASPGSHSSSVISSALPASPGSPGSTTESRWGGAAPDGDEDGSSARPAMLRGHSHRRARRASLSSRNAHKRASQTGGQAAPDVTFKEKLDNVSAVPSPRRRFAARDCRFAHSRPPLPSS